MKMLTCSKCGHEVNANARVCPFCHTELAGVKCPKCGRVHRESAYIANGGRCPDCKARVLHVPSALTDRSICPKCRQKKKNRKSMVCEHCGRLSWGRITAGFLAGVFLVLLGYLYGKMLPDTGAAIAVPLYIGALLLWAGAIKAMIVSYRIKKQQGK
ncbi:zinc ribbon domain-containing protein [bacterium]|nr:zinc ribbon domain-containing protein [bacterium]